MLLQNQLIKYLVVLALEAAFNEAAKFKMFVNQSETPKFVIS
jgi:hypothetical protein